MSAEEFWKDDPQLFVSYRTSFINKEKREMEKEDYVCWRQGLYIHDGNGKLIKSLKQMIQNIFSKTKDNSEIATYPTKPYSQLQKDELNKNKENIKKENYKDYENSLIYYGTLKKQYLDKLKSKKGE